MLQTKAENILYCLFLIPTFFVVRWLFGGSNAGLEILFLWAFINLFPTWVTLMIYEKLTGDNAASIESDLEIKITSIQEKLPKREIRNRSANGGRTPWIIVFVFGVPAGGVLTLFFPDNPFIAVIIGCGLMYVIGYVIVNKNKP